MDASAEDERRVIRSVSAGLPLRGTMKSCWEIVADEVDAVSMEDSGEIERRVWT